MKLVVTVGVFDLFHEGHVALLQRCREFGDFVAAGVPDRRVSLLTKGTRPMDDTETRMENTRKYADEVFCIRDADHSIAVLAYLDSQNFSSGQFVRGDDWPDFPGRMGIESRLPIVFVPRTPGISSTMLRQARYKEFMERIVNAMPHLKAPWWVDYGTALGCYRHRGPLPHDDDIDLSVLVEYQLGIEERLLATLRRHSDLWVDSPCAGLLRFHLNDRLYADLFLFRRCEDGTIYRLCDYSGSLSKLPPGANQRSIENHFLEHLGTSQFAGVTVPVPQPLEEFCCYRYGHTYNTRVIYQY